MSIYRLDNLHKFPFLCRFSVLSRLLSKVLTHKRFCLLLESSRDKKVYLRIIVIITIKKDLIDSFMCHLFMCTKKIIELFYNFTINETRINRKLYF